ncbi:MAG: bifunctional homocysteine S-methyltransferase/methylenetetrahydrofolate reductase [Deltaproteobacteria bacterium]|nr:bifunctional homocysteine S-methyltransferase/methylenetetrahydrofolate reductase [Deltaproteobacteria bacterium]
MSRPSFLECLEAEQVLLFDGAMGTQLYARGFFLNQCYDALNLTAPGVVREIHQDYAQAGARILTTNTFGGSLHKLKVHGIDAAEMRDINLAGAAVARAVAGDQLLVAGSVGPLGLRIEPFGPTSVDEAREMFAAQMEPLAEGGVDAFLLETFADLAEIHQAILAARRVAPTLPVIASMTVDNDGSSLYGTSPETFTRQLDRWGVDVIGLNCSVGPGPMLSALERMVAVTQKPICVQPNAGMPRLHEGRQIYLASAEYMAEYAKRFIQTGARLVGGCCGTTPGHVRAMRSAIRMQVPAAQHAKLARIETGELTEPAAEVPTAEKSPLAERLVNGKFPVTVELTPPRGWQPQKLLSAAQKLHQAGVDCVNLPDGPRASCRMSNQALSLLIHQQVGIEVLPHYCCRDRNLLGMMSDILGLAAMGLHNILLVTGDPPKMGDYPDATAVFDIDSIGLTNLVKLFNRGLDLGGNPVSPPTRFLIGVGCNPGALDIENEIARFRWKVEAGAEFAITQPVFDTDLLFRFLERIEEFRIPVMAGIWPLTSLRNAEFMNAEVPGATVPASSMERMAAAQQRGKDAARAEGVAIAREALIRVHDVVAGAQVSAPFGRIGYAFDVLEALNELKLDRSPITRPVK